METPFNSAALAGVVLGFPAGITNYHRACTGALQVISVRVVGKYFPWPFMWLFVVAVPAMVPTAFHTPLFIVKFFLLFGRLLHVDRNVIHVLIQGVVSYCHLFFKPWVEPSPELVHF